MKKIVIDNAIPFLRERLEPLFDCLSIAGAEIRPEHLRDADALIVRTRTRCNADLLQDSPVSFIATATIGLDHIDAAYCDSHHIRWQNAPGCNAPAVAQYVWRALLHLGFDPCRMTLGVVGKGNVGGIVTDWGRRLGANVLVCDPPRAARGLTDEEYLPLEELMSRCDAITIHTPLIRQSRLEDGIPVAPTYHLIDAEMLSLLRPGAILINAARGGIVDEERLVSLKGEKGLRIAIDTWENEPRISPATLRAADIATFHIAGYSHQGKERASRACLEGLASHFGIDPSQLNLDLLEGPYAPPRELTPAGIIASYDILTDDHAMRRNPADFERLRNTYPLRPEIP